MKKLSKNEKTAVFVSLAVILFFFAAAGVVGFISSNKVGNVNSAALADDLTENLEDDGISSSINANSMTITDTVIGTGEEAVAGKILTVHYTGTLADGTKFDSSLDRGEPFRFVLGAGQVIQGWEQGLAGMKVGGRRHLVIPPQLAYGDNAVGAIPAGSTLLFDVELLSVDSQ